MQQANPVRPLHALLLTLVCALSGQGCSTVLVTAEANAITDPPGERNFAERVSDEAIEIKAVVNMHAADDGFDDAHLVVVSYNGYVLIAGQVPTEELKLKASDVVRKIRDVRRIYNELEVAAPSSALSRTSDTWISTKVKSFLLSSRNTPGMRTKVVTESGVVYLMGLVTAEEADRITDMAADVSGVQRVVRLFELIDPQAT